MAATLFICFIILILVCVWLQIHRNKPVTAKNLPPGSFGWPFIGETLEFVRSCRNGTPEKFVRERIERHDSRLVFRTSLLGHRMAVFCGADGNKFLFGNENKLVASWWPDTMSMLLGECLITSRGDEAKWLRKIMVANLGPDAFSNRYIVTTQKISRRHIQNHWQGQHEVKVFETVKSYLFELACGLFLSLEDPKQVSELGSLFKTFLKGLGELPISIPGTHFYRAKNATNAIKKQLMVIIKQRRQTIRKENASSFKDLLSHLLSSSDENGRFLSEIEIANNIMLLLFAGHDTSAVLITLLMKSLGEHPHIYENVLKEQLGILEGKSHDELLNWSDIQKMRYSWNVVCEVLRLNPPVIGAFREALVDFEYAAMTHKEEENFPNVTNFDPSRFEGAGPMPFTYVPFGGGQRMCLGKELARVQALVFLHNIVRRFNWDLLIPNEKIEYDPMATPVKGLPVRLYPHQV
ncbi:hypothetical protein R6Q57_024107 [Mikania cordata]